MTPRMEFDDQLRAWADLGDERLPAQYLNGALDQIKTTPQARPGWWRFPEMNRFAPFAMAATALIVILLIGIGLFVRSPDVGPTPLPAPSDEANATPRADATPNPGGPLGGGLILVTLPHESSSPCGMGGFAPFELYSLDAGTGERTLLGTTSEDCSARHLQLQWARDRERILMTDEFGQETLTLDTATTAGRDLTFICCDLPTDVWEGGASHFNGWMLSPAGDRVAAIHTAEFQVPGQEGTTGISDGIVVANIDGTGQTFLPLPAGAAIRGWANWSPDQSALVVAACNPCNHAIEPGQPPTAENHDHLYVVPVDGSPVRELLDDRVGWFWTPAWSPDGSTFATVKRECPSAGAPPQCGNDSTTSLVLVAADDGAQRVVIPSEQLGEGLEFGVPVWSRDSARIAFTAYSATGDPLRVFVVDEDGTNAVDVGEGSLIQWSPDGEWLLVERPAVEEGFSDLWIMRADGSDARSLGTFLNFYLGAAW